MKMKDKAAVLGVMATMGGLGEMIDHEVSKLFPDDKHDRKTFKYPDRNGVMAFEILALNQESADAQYAKIMQKKNKSKSKTK